MPGPTAHDYAAELNPEQYAAVTTTAAQALVIAGAGSGKTRTLTYRVAWLLEHGVAPWRILLLTFTNLRLLVSSNFSARSIMWIFIRL